MSVEYTIQPTRAGDYIVRNPMGNELARFPTGVEARQWADDRTAQDAAEWAAAEQRRIAQDAWDHRDAGLFQAQLTWQRWRSWLYSELGHRSRNQARARRASASWPAGPAEEQAELDAAAALYDECVALDTCIKIARRERNAIALTAALDEAAAMIPRMKAAFPGAAPADEPPPVSETSRPKPTSVIVDDEQRAYLEARAPEFGNSVSAATREAIRRWMEQEPL